MSGDIWIITEPVTPLTLVLDSLSSFEITSGLYNIIEALSFLHSQVIVVSGYSGSVYLYILFNFSTFKLMNLLNSDWDCKCNCVNRKGPSLFDFSCYNLFY